MFDKMDVDVVKTLLIPALEILASPEYQERVWVKNLDPRLSNDYQDFFEGFFLACEGILSPGEEYRLDEKNRKAVEELYLEVRRFHLLWKFANGDIQAFIHHPDWRAIQRKAKEIVEILRPVVVARRVNVVKIHLIPALEKLSSCSYQEKIWNNPESEETYVLWLMDFLEICDFLLTDEKEKIDPGYEHVLNELFTKVNEFDNVWGVVLRYDPMSLIHHLEWTKIQHQAAQFLDLLKQEQKSKD